MLQVQKGFVSGEFLLPADLPAGNYYIRAYTAWMLNFSNTSFFYRKISVTDNRKPVKKPPSSGPFNFFVQFYPESGNLVSRLTSMVAFKAIDTNGLPVAISGKVFNNLGDTIALIKTTHNGTGSFVMHCTPQTIYTALVTANGITKKIPLPAVQTSGIVLHTETRTTGETDSIFFHISRSGINKEKFENLILCARMEDHFSVTKIHFDESTFNDPLDTVLSAPYPLLLNNFGKGVLYISVLTDSGNVLAERMVFLHQQQPDSIQIKPLKNDYSNNEKNGFTVSVPNNYAGTLAIAVTDAGTDDGGSNAIRSAIFLSPELATAVHDPEWYFDSSNPEASRALDVLLATCSAANTGLQNILEGTEQPIKYLPEKSIVVSGVAFEVNGTARTPLANSSLFLIVKAAADSLTLPLSVATDAAGFFTVPNLLFHDTASIYIQTGAKTPGTANSNIAVEFYKNIFDSISQYRYAVAPIVLNARLTAIHTDSLVVNTVPANQAGMLTNVTVTARTKTHLDSVLAKYASGMFANPGSWAQTLDLTNDPITANADQDVLAWLNGKAAGLNYSYSNGKPLIYWRFSNVIAGLSNVEQIKLNSPAFFLNEALLSAGLEGYDAAIDLLAGIRIADVALIRIYKPGTMPNVPDNGPHGSIAIYLKNGTEMDKTSAKINFERTSKTGYTINHRFNEVNARMKKSSTLYWNPALKVDPITHSASFNFNDNGLKRVRISAEGMDENGKIISLSQLININNQ